MNALTTNVLARRLVLGFVLFFGLLANTACGQMTATPLALGIANFQGYIVAGDTNVGGRQAIQVAGDIQFAIGNDVATTNVFILKYQLLDQGGQPAPIMDENGQSNVVYSIYQTTILPWMFGGWTFDSEQIAFSAPLQPWTQLDYYEKYTPQLQVYSTPWPTNQASVFQLAGQVAGPAKQYLDFTNTASPDASPNVEVVMTAPPSILRSWSIGNSPDYYGFPVNVNVAVARYDDYTLPSYPTNVAVTLNFQLLNAGTGASVPLQSSQTVLNVSMASNDGSTPPNPAIRNLSPVFKVIPAVQLDSVNATYQLVVTLAHTVGATTVNDYTNTLAATQMLDFNGQFYFGGLLTYFTNLDQPPIITSTTPGSWVHCQLDVSANTGTFPQAPGYTYGTGSYLDAHLLPNGAVQLASGTLPINAPSSSQTVKNISFQTFSPTLSTSGASEGVALTLPTGFGITPPGSANRLTVGSLSLGTVPLDDTLNPQNVTIPGPIQAVAENLPVWFCGTSLLWNVTNGTLALALTNGAFVRQTEDDLLSGSQNTLVDPTMANRVSNDGYFRNASIVSGQFLRVSADANGSAQLSGYVQLSPPELRPHFPYSGSQDGVQISIGLLGGNNNGALTLSNNVITADSFLAFDPGFPAPIIYGRDTQDTNCASSLAGPGTMYFTPQQGGPYGFTADGGLLASGSVPVTNLTWGYVGSGNYAQEALNVQNGVFEMAGTVLAGGQSQVTPAELPAVLLLSGFGHGVTNSYVERPNTPAYYAGLASYPGINFTSPANGFSCLGATTLVGYALAPDAKYYARYAGVSGIHDAANFPSTLQLYNYAFTFTSYRLSFLDSEVDRSLVAGTIVFPSNPSGFTQPFTNMLFSDRGYLESATVPPASGIDHLHYWNVDLAPKSIEFAPQTSDTCGTGPRFLVLGAETQLPLIPQKLHAALGFRYDGNLVTVTDNVAGCDSRFAVPAQLSLQAHSGGSFPLATAAEGYFNNYETPGSPAAGFFNLAGKLRLPFFTDMRVHLHVQPFNSTNALISMMGGWPDPSTPAANEGWNEGTNNFFNTAKFDPSAQGFPADQNVSCSDYEGTTGSSSLQFHPIAQRDWIKVATFEYPLQWHSVLGKFTGFQPGKAALPLLTVGSNLKTLIPGKVDMDFAEDISLQLPVVKVVDLISDAAGADGALQSVSTALGSAFDTAGLNELQGLLREDSTALFQPILTNAFNGLATQIYTALANLYQSEGSKAAFLPDAYQQIQGCNFTSALTGIAGAAGQANTLAGQIGQTLTDVEGDVNQFVNLLDPNGNYQGVQKIVGQLVQDQASVLGPLAGAANNLVGTAEGLVSSYGSALGELRTEFKGVKNQLDQTRNRLTDSAGDFAKALAEPLNNSSSGSAITAFETLAASDLTNYLARALTPQGDYFTANPDAVKQAIQQQLQNAFLNSSLLASYQTTLRQFLFDDNATVGELMDATFDQINGAIRDGLATIISNTDTNFGPFNNFPKTLFSAKIRGSPTFNGDSLRKIHLNASVQMDLPDSMTFNAYMEIKELCSQTVPQDCIPQGDPAAEVTLGAKNVKLDWPALNPSGTPLTLTVAAKWTLQDGNVIGMGGLFDVQGQIGVDGYSLNEIGATLAFGKVENYFAAKVAGTFTVLGVPINANGGIFVGEACTVNPILWIDPQAASTLAANNLTSFSGVYTDCGVSLSLSQILFGESSCFLDIGANISGATYYECTSWPSVSIGMRQTIGVDASLLCLISASASLTMSEIASCSDFPLSGYSLTLAGDAQICGSIGPCPFCISGCKSLSVTGTVNKGGVDYHVNY